MSTDSDHPKDDRARLPRFSLRALLALMAVACVLLAPIQMLGSWYGLSMAFSLAVLLFTWGLYAAYGTGASMLAAVPLVLLGLGGALHSIPFFLHTVLNAVAMGLCGCFGLSPKKTLIALLAVLGFPYGIAIQSARNVQAMVDSRREAHPLQSIESRLNGLLQGRDLTTREPLIGTAVDNALTSREQERFNTYNSRHESLKNLHDDSFRRFVSAQGFGPIRMLDGFFHQDYRAASAVDNPLPISVANRYAAQADEIHSGAIGEFLDRDRIGYVRSVEQVAGFEGHAFTQLPVWAAQGDTSEGWQLTRLQLVSLLRHDEPVVYLTDELPQMEQIAEFPHRPLNNFETQALPKIQTQTDVYVDEGVDLIQMLGAVRADQSCVVCHGGSRGELLGAFSYELRRTILSE